MRLWLLASASPPLAVAAFAHRAISPIASAFNDLDVVAMPSQDVEARPAADPVADPVVPATNGGEPAVAVTVVSVNGVDEPKSTTTRVSEVGASGEPDKKAGEGGGYINMDAGASPQQLLKGFNPLLLLTEALGLVLVILTAVWCAGRGFGWRDYPALEFNWHPLLMIIALVFLNGNALLTFRVLRNNRKVLLKYIHGGIQFITLPLIVVGLVAVFDSHNFATPPVANLYTIHSWLGLGAVILFLSQWLLGFIAFLFPGLSAEYRSFILPYHVFNGVFTFGLSVAVSLLGLTEKAIFALGSAYKDLQSEAVLINTIAIVLTLFSLMVGLLVTKAEYKRTPLPEDGSPLLSGSSQRQQ